MIVAGQQVMHHNTGRTEEGCMERLPTIMESMALDLGLSRTVW